MALVRMNLDRVDVGAPPPALPTNVVATPGNGSVLVSWTAPSPSTGVTDYLVQYKLSSSGTWLNPANTVSTDTSATLSPLTNGSSYDFRVAAVRGAEVGEYTSAVSATPVAPALPGPSNLLVTPGDRQVTLNWTAPSPATGVTDYSVQAKWVNDIAWNQITRTASTTTSQVVSPLTNGQSYNFRVAAIRSGTVGDYTATATGSPVSPAPDDLFSEHEGFGNPGLVNPVRIVVTNNNDSGPGSLRAAIAGNAHKHITFASDMTIKVVSALLRPGSNTLIDGSGKNIAIEGNLSMGGFIFENVYNVTVFNVTVRKCGNVALTSSDNPWDAFIMYGSRDIWLHHLDLSTTADKAVGIQRGCGGVTVSWCHFHDQVQVFQIGSDSGGEAVDGTQSVTIHHNWWDKTGYRHPVLSYGKAHVYNNYFLDWDNYGARSQRVGKMVFEHNALLGLRDGRAVLTTGTGGADKDTRPGFVTYNGALAGNTNWQMPGSVALSYAAASPGSTFNPDTFYANTPDVANQTLVNRIVAGAGPTR